MKVFLSPHDRRCNDAGGLFESLQLANASPGAQDLSITAPMEISAVTNENLSWLTQLRYRGRIRSNISPDFAGGIGHQEVKLGVEYHLR